MIDVAFVAVPVSDEEGYIVERTVLAADLPEPYRSAVELRGAVADLVQEFGSVCPIFGDERMITVRARVLLDRTKP